MVQRDGLGQAKADAVSSEHGALELRVLDIHGPFPDLVDEPEEALPGEILGIVREHDLVLDFLYHPDLSDYLAQVCKEAGVPVIASGRRVVGAVCPTTCCTLPEDPALGRYAELFGAPRLEVDLDESGSISQVRCLRRAPCGATDEAAAALLGKTKDEALRHYGLLVQFHCKAKARPGLFLKNPLHIAAEVHTAALKRVLDRGGE